MDRWNTNPFESRLRSLIEAQPAGHSLLQTFYRHPEIYRSDVDSIWRKGWLFAGHSCEIKKPGDFFTINVDTDSVVVVRDEKGKAHALHNVCRHRGSLICEDSCGQMKRMVCPYHQWTYALDGSLLHAPGMQKDLDKSELGLRRAQAREVEGLIFISLAEEPPTFDPAQEMVQTYLRPQGLTKAKVAKVVDYL